MVSACGPLAGFCVSALGRATYSHHEEIGLSLDYGSGSSSDVGALSSALQELDWHVVAGRRLSRTRSFVNNVNTRLQPSVTKGHNFLAKF